MKIIGLTGSIGMGKSETAKMFVAEGIPVFDADAEVHRLQKKDGKALPLIEEAFPGSVKDGELDRQALGQHVFSDPNAKKKLEAIMHPMVGEARVAFFNEAEKNTVPFVVVDVPLLFETGGNKACDKVITVSAPADVQRERVLARPGMTVEKFEHILGLQVPDAEKRAGSDFVIETDKGLKHAHEQVRSIIKILRNDV